jgi:AcrR family transcriptional regulator
MRVVYSERSTLSMNTRNRILEAADELFYREGIRSVSVNTIAEKAGVTKRTLYYHFRSKDDLIAAYLEARDEPTLGRYRRWFEEFDGTVAERIAGMFGRLAVWAKSPRWKGCGFARAAAELAGAPGHPAIAVASRHKKCFEQLFVELLRSEGVSQSALVARQLMVLLDGAITEILIHHDYSYAEVAGDAAMTLIEANRKRPRELPGRRDLARRGRHAYQPMNG